MWITSDGVRFAYVNLGWKDSAPCSLLRNDCEPEEGYQREWIQTRNARPNSPGKWSRDEKRSYFIRVRTMVDDTGKIVTANYGKLYGDFLSFTYYLNPNMNSRNMEFDPRQNLFGELRGSERVQKP